MIKVFTHTYNEIFDTYANISVPEYQRPYRWSTEKVEELLIDLEEFFIKKPQLHLEYYIGSVLLFNNLKENKHEIIDGQQRLTTLTLLQFIINGSLETNQNLNFNNHISFGNIKDNIAYLEKRKDLLAKLNELNFLEKLRLTVIISENEDNAFAFFDSQNNRGVTLGADDYLKAYHLREVKSETLQEKLAQQWEQTVFKSQKENNYELGLLHLFYKILYRARKWKGQTQLIPEDKTPILNTFQKQTIENTNKDIYELFPGRVNQKFKFLKVNEDDSIQMLPEEVEEQQIVDFPFTLRQPIFKGHNFFQFAQKYHAIYKLLFYEPNVPESMMVARKYYNLIYTGRMTIYLRHYIQLCMVMYYDSFGDAQIDKAIQYFDYLIGSIRIEKYYVKKEAVKNSLMGGTSNLLDVIANAYIPAEIFDFIKEHNASKIIYEKENLEGKEGVRNAYKQSVLKYFDKSDIVLKERLTWIK
jgi:hypothetical protein